MSTPQPAKDDPPRVALALVEALANDADVAARAGDRSRAAALHEAAARVALGAACRTTEDELPVRGRLAVLGVAELVHAGRFEDAARTAEAYLDTRSLGDEVDSEIRRWHARALAARPFAA